MTDSVKEKVFSAIENRLKTLTITNGYDFDLGLSVSRCDVSQTTKDIPFMVLWDLDDQVSSAYGQYVTTTSFIVHFLVDHGNNNPSTVMASVLANILKCIHVYDSSIDSLCESLVYNNFSPAWPEKGTRLMEGILSFSVTYNINRNDPYSNNS
jgi:hypothetical protein